MVNIEPAQARFQLQPAGYEGTVGKLCQLGLEIRTVSPPAEIKYIEVNIFIYQRQQLLSFYLNITIREPYKVRKPKIVWKFPNLGLTPPPHTHRFGNL